MFRNMGKRMRPPSKANARPAPREHQTDHLRLFRPASFSFVACRASVLVLNWHQDKSRWSHLAVPAVGEEKEVKAVEYHIVGQPSWHQELPLEPVDRVHICVRNAVADCSSNEKYKGVGSGPEPARHSEASKKGTNGGVNGEKKGPAKSTV